MPGFTTHYIFGLKSYRHLDSCRLKYLISRYRGLYQLGLQGPDMFFYYIPGLRHRGFNNVGSTMHSYRTGDFFETFIRHIGSTDSNTRQGQAIAYLAGLLSHYAADSICHPYIYALSDHCVEHPNAASYGRHAELENDIDAILLWHYKKKKPSEFSQTATILLNGQEIQFISRFLSECINSVYYPVTVHSTFRVTPAMVHRSIIAMKIGTRTLSDSKGHKRLGLAVLESLVMRRPVASAKMVTDGVVDYHGCLNTAHEPWINPWDPSLISTESFPDLFGKTIEKTDGIFRMLNHSIECPISLQRQNLEELLTVIGSNSYHSGLPTGHEMVETKLPI